MRPNSATESQQDRKRQKIDRTQIEQIMGPDSETESQQDRKKGQKVDRTWVEMFLV